VNGSEGVEFELEPTPLLAATVTVYAVPFVSPVTVHERLDVVHDAPLGDAVTV
jgi:hypothetical protein